MNIVAERVNRGLSQSDAAAEIGVSRGTLDRAERGLRIQTARAKRIADFYGVKVTDLWPVQTDHSNGSAAA
ncbi:MAG: helix-turn-helix transcriptional regulator [Acidiferrobacteraceae bacterium]